jgi:uncharacterized membrane protein HdeD (DUF308 family)
MPRHPFDPLSLVSGVLFAVIGITAWTGPLDLSALRFDLLLPLAVVLIGFSLIFQLRPRTPEDREEELD